MRFYVRGESYLDKVGRSDAMMKVQGFQHDLKDIQKWKGHWDEVMAQGGTPGGNGPIRWVARMPRALWELWMRDDPTLVTNKKKFFKQLDDNPQYAIYRRRRS